MDLIDTLLAFNEWQDGEGLLADPKSTTRGTASHEDIAKEFVSQWEAREGMAPLPGRPDIVGDLSAVALGLSPIQD